MYENDGWELIEIISGVKESGLTTLLDMTQLDPDSHTGNAKWLIILTSMLPYMDVFTDLDETLFTCAGLS